ncbi:SRPBCC family protein [Pseudomonas tolaasii]|uniref:SRPBCC family protein n=2 Tax=Pseudomonas tolaasii TaxID=29442 RepID=A0A7Y8ATA9_PSETO|nr:SRPBCC family protein [Pseudomonas tolaasii]ARB30669.1 MxaD family protein [Pseudomonas tolaasii]KAB0464378.1 SRPBCC family protein [Pseudomonas tolaasii]MBY8944147.1 SRPBCC family protein [Pseudomonas tolaasii]NWC24456.1 SRPBCC family protein [Pseudomonas tolaasii]NWC43059.1 SRPBCC family protein [Pseudomonas tolaasii]
MKLLQPDTLIRNPQGAPLVASIEVDCEATCLWQLVGNFAGFDAFIPALSHIEMTGAGVGALRKKFFRDGHCVVEQLNSRDDEAMYMTWTTLYNTLGIARLWAAMSVQAVDANRSRATWTLVGEPVATSQAEFERFAQGFIDAALENARQMLG